MSPFPVPFPYNINVPPDQPANDVNAFVETWLSERESLHPQPPPKSHPDAPLRKYTAKKRSQHVDLIGISETGLRDCVPHLDVGDAFSILGSPTLATKPDDTDGHPSESSDIPEIVEARQDLVDILGGQSTLMSPPDSEAPLDSIPFAPWSLRYSGHQFGSWAGQLGDGRAISIRE